jgi:hypothetical protein
MLWNGNYYLSEMKAYPMRLENKYRLEDGYFDFWLDNQQHFKFFLGPDGKSRYHLYNEGLYFMVMAGKRAPNQMLNNISFSWSNPENSDSPGKFYGDWEEKDINTYTIVFLGEGDWQAARYEGRYDPKNPKFSVGAGTDYPISDTICRVLIFATLEADPEGRYYNESRYSGVDLDTTFDVTSKECSPGCAPSEARADVCINSLCKSDFEAYHEVWKKTLESPKFIPYNAGSDKTKWKGLFSKSHNTYVISLHRSKMSIHGNESDCLFLEGVNKLRYDIEINYSRH